MNDSDLANPQEAIFGTLADQVNELSRRLMLWSDATVIQARLTKGQRLDDVLQAPQRKAYPPKLQWQSAKDAYRLQKPQYGSSGAHRPSFWSEVANLLHHLHKDDPATQGPQSRPEKLKLSVSVGPICRCARRKIPR